MSVSWEVTRVFIIVGGQGRTSSPFQICTSKTIYRSMDGPKNRPTNGPTDQWIDELIFFNLVFFIYVMIIVVFCRGEGMVWYWVKLGAVADNDPIIPFHCQCTNMSRMGDGPSSTINIRHPRFWNFGEYCQDILMSFCPVCHVVMLFQPTEPIARSSLWQTRGGGGHQGNHNWQTGI